MNSLCTSPSAMLISSCKLSRDCLVSNESSDSFNSNEEIGPTTSSSTTGEGKVGAWRLGFRSWGKRIDEGASGTDMPLAVE